jgi:hypothetical protein
MLYNATANRRAKISPYVTRSSIDPHLGVFRVDDLTGKLCTLLRCVISHRI